MPDTTFDETPRLPEGERMSPAELKVVREFLGFSVPALAAHLHVSDRTVRFWEDGRYEIPAGVAKEIARLEQESGAFAADLAEQWAGEASPTLATYRSDADYREADPRGTLPASWHRAAVARARDRLPGAAVVYAEPVTVPVIPALSIMLFCQLLDVLQGTVIDAPALQDPRGFLIGEITDTLDDADERIAYPDLMQAALSWTPKQCAGVLGAALRYRGAAESGGDHADGLRAAGYAGAA